MSATEARHGLPALAVLLACALAGGAARAQAPEAANPVTDPQTLAAPVDDAPTDFGGDGRDLVVLLPDPERPDSAAEVTNAEGTILLVRPRSGARVAPGQAPVPVEVTEEEVQATFGEALGAEPARGARVLLTFRFDSTELLPESQVALRTLIDELRRRPAPRVTLIGHADTVGRVGYNDDLAARRAEAIARALAAAGLPRGAIAVDSSGERDLLVPTPDETPERRNRRVEVVIR